MARYEPLDMEHKTSLDASNWVKLWLRNSCEVVPWEMR